MGQKCPYDGHIWTIADSPLYVRVSTKRQSLNVHLTDNTTNQGRERMSWFNELTNEQKEKVIWLRSQQQLRSEVFNNHIQQCFICGATQDLLLHHIKYWPPQEVILCRNCHLAVHAEQFRKKRIKTIRGLEQPNLRLLTKLRKLPFDKQKELIEKTLSCKDGECKNCNHNCSIQQIRLDHIKILIQENKGRWTHA